MYKLALNAGHGINTPGKRCLKSIDSNETGEWILNSRICKKIEQRLAEYDGIEVKRIDDVTGVKDIPIKERAAVANNFNADLYLAIHHNAGINGGSGGGIMAFTYLSVDDKTALLQKRFYDAAIKFTGLKGNRSTPLGKQDLGECRMTKMPAILMECGFMDSVTDTPVILTEDFADKIAEAFTQVIVGMSGATLKVSVHNYMTNTEDKEIQKNSKLELPSNILYRVRKSFDDSNSQTGAFSVLENAINLAKQTNNNVYDPWGKCIWSYNEFILSELKSEESESSDIDVSEDKKKKTINQNYENCFLQLLKSILHFLKCLFK